MHIIAINELLKGLHWWFGRRQLSSLPGGIRRQEQPDSAGSRHREMDEYQFGDLCQKMR